MDKETIIATLAFLQRTQIAGQEAETYIKCVSALKKILTEIELGMELANNNKLDV